jgi:para-nitrobenzyl esterase
MLREGIINASLPCFNCFGPLHPRSIGRSCVTFAPTVRTSAGLVEGTRDTGVDKFLGIPFAAPPVGDLRWKPPLPPTPWSGVRSATTFSASCMQITPPESPASTPAVTPWTYEYLDHQPVSEDCLYLNVWSPKASAKSRLPVVVWIHGGAFMVGSGAVPIYDGEGLAGKGSSSLQLTTVLARSAFSRTRS